MATIEDAIRTRLTGLAAVTAITSTVRPYRLQEGDALPAVVVSVDEETHQNTMDDGLGGVVAAQVRIQAVAETLAGARALAEAIRGSAGSAMAGYQGTISGLEIQGSVLQRKMIDFQPYGDASDEGFYYVDSIYLIHYVETP